MSSAVATRAAASPAPTMSLAPSLGLTEEHRALAESVRAFAKRAITAETVRKAVESNRAEQFPAFWSALVGQDLLGLHLPERDGGAEAGLLTLAVAVEALSRTVAPGPFVPTVLASALLTAADVPVPAGLVDGSATAAVALAGDFTCDEAAVSGSADAVLGADTADLLVLPLRDGSWALVERAHLTVTAQDSIDVLRGSARVVADGASALARFDLPESRARAVAAVVLGAEALGVMTWCVETAAAYARTREQFGRPIGQFQGVKHKCAQMAIALEQARAVVWDAAQALDSGEDTADFAGAIAAAFTPDAAVTCAQDNIQVHGGIGFTWEHDAHLYYRRALAIRGVLGAREDRVRTVAEMSLAGAVRPTAVRLPDEAETLRASISAELAPIAELPEDPQLIALGDGGWVQPHLPKPYGRGAGPLEQIVIAQEIEAAGIAMPQLLMGSWATQAIVFHGTEQQKQELAVPTLRGDLVWCQLFSEPGAGSDLASLRTKAVKVDGGWRVTGQKIWTTVAQFADWAMLIARTSPDKPKHQGITYFVVDMASPGILVRPLREMTGSALFNEVFLDDVFIPDAHVVGDIDEGWSVARTTLAGERVALSQKMEAYATDRDLVAFARSHPLGEVSRYKYGELITEGQSIDLIGTRVVLQQLAGIDGSSASSVGKLLAMRFGQAVSEFVVAELGAAGVVSVPGEPSEKAVEQLLAGRATTIYGGTTEVQLNVIGERMLGLPRDV